jgi:hypothetical protein
MGTASCDGTEAAESAQPDAASPRIGAYPPPSVADFSELHLEEWHEAQEECIPQEEDGPQGCPCLEPCLQQIPTREQIASSTSSPALVLADAGVAQHILNADPAHLPVNCGTCVRPRAWPRRYTSSPYIRPNRSPRARPACLCRRRNRWPHPHHHPPQAD